MTAAAWAAVTLSAVLALVSLAGCLALHRKHDELRKLIMSMLTETGGSDDLPAPGRHVEPFTAATTAGEAVDESVLAGPTVLVGFFLVGCSMCHGELVPFERFAGGPLAPARTLAVVVGVEPGSAGDGGYVAALEPHADVVADEQAAVVATAFGLTGYPAFCLVRDGVVLAAAHSVDELGRSAAAAVSPA